MLPASQTELIDKGIPMGRTLTWLPKYHMYATWPKPRWSPSRLTEKLGFTRKKSYNYLILRHFAQRQEKPKSHWEHHTFNIWASQPAPKQQSPYLAMTKMFKIDIHKPYPNERMFERWVNGLVTQIEHNSNGFKMPSPQCSPPWPNPSSRGRLPSGNNGSLAWAAQDLSVAFLLTLKVLKKRNPISENPH